MLNRRLAALPALALLVSSLHAAPAVTSAPYLVQNISTTLAPVSSSPHLFRRVGSSYVFFIASDPARGAELWVSDGTASGTNIVRDISEGPTGGCANTREIVDFNGIAIFTAEGTEGAEPWRSGCCSVGTMAATLLKDIAPNGGSSPHDYTPASDQLFFIATDTATGVWVTDATTTGTHLAVNGGWGTPYRIGPAFGRKAFVFADNGTFLTTGAAQGTLKIAAGTQSGDLPGLSINLSLTSALVAAGDEIYVVDQTGQTLLGNFPGAHAFTRAGSTIFFSTPDGIWTTDGTPAGTKHISGAQSPELLTGIGNRLFFTAVLDGQRRPWVSDGTGAGTFALSLDEVMAYPAPASFAGVAGNAAVFATNSGLWRTDGTVSGTSRLSTAPGISADLASFGNYTLFAASDDETGNEPWMTDGTSAKTARLKDLAEGNRTKAPISLTAAFNRLFFLVPHAESYELWSSEGAGVNTHRSDLIPDGLNVSALYRSCAGLLYLTACPIGSGQCSLWRSDGTAAGTFAMDDMPPVSGSTTACYGGAVFYLGYDYSTRTTHLRKSLGTRATTSEVASIPKTSAYAVGPLAAAHGLVFYVSSGGSFVSDGTQAGTRQMLYGSFYYDSLYPWMASDSYVFWTATSREGNVVYRSDGTIDGTIPLGGYAWRPSLLRAVGDTLYFSAGYGHIYDSGLYATDGTLAGTRFVMRSPYPGSAIVGFHGLHYYLTGEQLDGEPKRGGLMTIDPKSGKVTIAPATDTIMQLSQPPGTLVAAGDHLFFPGRSTSPSMTGIWKVDEAANTAQFVGPTSDAFATHATTAIAAGDRLYFMYLTDSGAELWALSYNGSRIRAVRP